jgi:hydrogenase assembly chaperone HypC/HupF
VIDVDGFLATVDFWGVRRQIRLDIVDEPVAPGDYVLNHVGYAIRRIPAEVIGETLALYESLLADSEESLADAQAEGARVDVVYSVAQAVDLARSLSEEVVFFSTGFETTAVATAAAILDPGRPKNLSILSAHKYILPAMEIVAEIPGTRIEGFLGAGSAGSRSPARSTISR